MTVNNGYCTLADFKAYITAAGQSLNPDTLDDNFIDKTITRASRRVDDLLGRRFYPRIETRYYDTPKDDVLWLDDDLLDVLWLINGDATVVASTDYNLHPANDYPKYAIQLKDVATIYWQLTTTSSADRAITLAAIWGFRERYGTEGWKTGSTLNEGGVLNATDLTFTVTSGSLFAKDQVIKIENELMTVASVSGANVTVVARGGNGSTAVTHADTTAVYIWQFPDDIEALTLEIARIMYRSRYGENVETTAITTPAGVVITPRSLPVWAQEIIGKYQRLV